MEREKHLQYLLKGFHHGFPSQYTSLDASRPWLVYWSLHSIDLLGHQLADEEISRTLQTLAKFQVEGEGGFAGGDYSVTGHVAHLAPTYAAILSLAILATPQAYTLVNRPALAALLRRLKTPDGAFRMHDGDGEVDVRSVYCAVVVGKLTGCWDEELEEGVVKWISTCQTWEGGFGGVPGAEAHGGYTYCAVSALLLLLSPAPIPTDHTPHHHHPLSPTINTKSLLYWLTSQQVQPIGGFRGRTNKLVDGCYSFWMGATFEGMGWGQMVDSVALQRFVLLACQDEMKGGLRDKPGK